MLSEYERKVGAWFLALQGLAGLVWWYGMFSRPLLRGRFMPEEWPNEVLFSFVLPDLVLFIGLSFVAAAAVHRNPPKAPASLLILLGALLYATLTTWGIAYLSGEAWMGAGAMTASLIVPGYLAVRMRR